MKIINYLGLLNKGVSNNMDNEAKEQIGGFLGMLGAILLVYMLASKWVIGTTKKELEQGRTFNPVSSFN